MATNDGVKITVSDEFDGGNIAFVKQKVDPDDPKHIVVKVEIKPDPYTELEKINHMQYFAFGAKATGLKEDQEITYVIENAGKASYPAAWTGSTVFYTSNLNDPDSWKRKLDTHYVQGQLVWAHNHIATDETKKNGDTVYFSYFPPYTHKQHMDMITKCRETAAGSDGKIQVLTLGQSLDGRDIECITLGDGDRTCWIIHRQHPGETMAEYFAEGLVTRLLKLQQNGDVDEKVDKLLNMYTFYIVPCMCPDGGVRGHLRTNAAGANLNREWQTKGDYEAPTLKRSPEVYAVLNKMDETGCDLFLDVHGDEELPFNFLSGAEKVPTWGQRLESLHGAFVASFCRATKDFQPSVGYPPADSPDRAAQYLNVATNQIATRFDCLAMTLEMPFKDCESNKDPERGWSPERARQLGRTVLEPIEYVHPYLRTDSLFWNALPLEDKYVAPSDTWQADDGFVPLKRRFYSDVRDLQ